MNIDEKIKSELENDKTELDAILAHEDGLFAMAFASFKGGLGRWLILMNVLILVVSGFMVWTGYRFFVAEVMQDQVFWGICVLIMVNLQIAMKQWLWMEINRGSLMREIKRVEISISRLGGR